MQHPEITLLEHDVIRSVGDFLRLHLVDWNRYKEYWTSPQHAMDIVSSWFIGAYYYYILEVDLWAYPQRDDFPGWKHAGDHEEQGQLYWNHFHYLFDGDLHFGDAPDFSGIIYREQPRKPLRIYGDFGQTSPIVMREATGYLHVPDTLWVSVQDAKRLIVLEPLLQKQPRKMQLSLFE